MDKDKKLNNQEILVDLFTQQKKLDDDIKHEHGIKELSLDKLRVAFYTELGEAYQACKKYWCWWKKTCKEVDRADLLEELADCLHFALSFQIREAEMSNVNKHRFKSWDEMVRSLVINTEFGIKFDYEGVNLEDVAFEYSANYVACTIALAKVLGYSIDELYLAYLKKNNVNHKRVESGY
jgi:dimeric dUTPase (all-alpha-NTP-PPase superfamily)